MLQLKLRDKCLQRFAVGLHRQSIKSCAKWAENYRIMGSPFPGPYSFRHHPWCKDMHNTDAPWVGPKAAQLGFTETALNRAFFTIDILRRDVLYILPNKFPDASDFSNSRFSPAIELSKHLSDMFSDVSNVGHKRSGTNNLFIRGSKSRVGLKSVPCALVVFDEVDEMAQENIPLAEERMSGQVEKQDIKISTPTVDNYGIDKYYQQSTQEHFFFKCPHCGKYIELVFPDNIVITAEEVTDPRIKDTYLKCDKCDGVLTHLGKADYLQTGIWVPTFEGREIRGFHVNQLYSPTVTPTDLAKAYFNSLHDKAAEQEFYNSKLGKVHIVDGAKITDEAINNVIGSHSIQRPNEAPSSTLRTMGVDVGTWFHYEICDWYRNRQNIHDTNLIHDCKVIAVGKVKTIEEIEEIKKQYRVFYTVIDANPERRVALNFATKFYGHVKLCFYGNGITSRAVNVHADEEQTITVDRTSWLDLSLGRYKFKTISLPLDIPKEYRDHMKCLVRVYKTNNAGEVTASYVKTEGQDHYAHARNYCELALYMAASIGKNLTIVGR